MDTSVILRRGGWRSPEDLQQAAERSTAEGDKMIGVAGVLADLLADTVKVREDPA